MDTACVPGDSHTLFAHGCPSTPFTLLSQEGMAAASYALRSVTLSYLPLSRVAACGTNGCILRPLEATRVHSSRFLVSYETSFISIMFHLLSGVPAWQGSCFPTKSTSGRQHDARTAQLDSRETRSVSR